MEYTRSAFTFTSDKLPALSGIASIMYLRSNSTGRYHAGLWESRFPEHLCGDTNLEYLVLVRFRCRYTELRLRSWASADCLLGWSWPRFGRWSLDAKVRLLECFTETKGLNPFGEVLRAKIVIDGPVMRVCPGFGHDTRCQFGLVNPENGNLLLRLGMSVSLDYCFSGAMDRVDFTSPERRRLLLLVKKQSRAWRRVDFGACRRVGIETCWAYSGEIGGPEVELEEDWNVSFFGILGDVLV